MSLGAATLRTPSQASCTPSTGAHGCLGCDGGFTEGAYEYLQSVAGLANAFYIPYRQSLTRTSSTKAWPTLACTATLAESKPEAFWLKNENYNFQL